MRVRTHIMLPYTRTHARSHKLQLNDIEKREREVTKNKSKLKKRTESSFDSKQKLNSVFFAAAVIVVFVAHHVLFLTYRTVLSSHARFYFILIGLTMLGIIY